MTFSFLFPSFNSEENYLPCGARYFLYPNIEFLQIANFLPENEISYFDERVVKIDEERLGDVVFIYTVLEVSPRRIREMARRLEGKGKRVILFGPLVSKKPEIAGDFPYIRGSILNVFQQIREDLARGRLLKEYDAGLVPNYLLPRWDLKIHNLNSTYQSTNFVLGCRCPEEIRPFCPQAIYYGDRLRKRGREEMMGEIITLPYKRVFLLDEDITFDLGYYQDIFSYLWQFKKEWIVNASKEILKHPDFLRFLGKVGVRIIYLKEDFLPSEELYSINREGAREKRKGVKKIQSERILVGIKMALFLKEGVNYDPIVRNIALIDPDFIEICFFKRNGVSLLNMHYHPAVDSKEPIWLKSRFYSFRSILSRLIKRPRRVGLYTTFFYSLPINLYYRQNFLEGIPYPP